jgi:hypothetical protein
MQVPARSPNRSIYLRLAPVKGRSDGARKRWPGERELPGESMEVVEILHAAIAFAKDDE